MQAGSSAGTDSQAEPEPRSSTWECRAPGKCGAGCTEPPGEAKGIAYMRKSGPGILPRH